MLLLYLCTFSPADGSSPLLLCTVPLIFFAFANSYVTKEMDSKGLSLMSIYKVIKNDDSESVCVCVWMCVIEMTYN